MLLVISKNTTKLSFHHEHDEGKSESYLFLHATYWFLLFLFYFNGKSTSFFIIVLSSNFDFRDTKKRQTKYYNLYTFFLIFVIYLVKSIYEYLISFWTVMENFKEMYRNSVCSLKLKKGGHNCPS